LVLTAFDLGNRSKRSASFFCAASAKTRDNGAVAAFFPRQLKFPGGSSMKVKVLFIIALFALGCTAAFGQSYALGFLSNDQSKQYCDYETFAVAKPYAAGTHVLTVGCSEAYDAPMIGFMGTIPATSGAPVTGAVVLLADGVIDAQYQTYSGLQAIWVTKTKASTKAQLAKGIFGWSFYYDLGGNGTDYLGNYGFLTTHLGPAAKNAAVKTSFGK
jgi:hypothetical protein